MQLIKAHKHINQIKITLSATSAFAAHTTGVTHAKTSIQLR